MENKKMELSSINGKKVGIIAGALAIAGVIGYMVFGKLAKRKGNSEEEPIEAEYEED